MESTSGLYTSALLLGAVHGVFLGLALLRTGNGAFTAHLLLASLTLTFAADLGVDFLVESGFSSRLPGIELVEDATSFLYGPLVYLYVVALTARHGLRPSAATWIHFLPFVASLVVLVGLHGFSDGRITGTPRSDAIAIERPRLREFVELIIELAPLPLIGFYLVVSIRRVILHGREVRDHFSSLERVSLIWLRNLLTALGSLYLIYALAVLLPSSSGSGNEFEPFLNLASVGLIYAMGYLGLRQPVVFSGRRTPTPTTDRHPIRTDTETSAAHERGKYRKSALDERTSALLLDELQQHMDVEKPYLDSTLTLSQLAEQTGISSNYLSQVINQQTDGNFFDFVNRHRVATAKRLLADPERFGVSILAIAMAAGFNSKSAFYSAFRQHADQTPSEFRRAIRGSGAPVP